MIRFDQPLNRAIVQSTFWIIAIITFSWLPLWNNLSTELWVRNFLLLVVQVGLIWLNILVLVPKLFLKGQRILYILSFLFIIGLIGLLFMPPGPPRQAIHLPEIPPLRPPGFGQPTPVMRFGTTAFPLLIAVVISLLIEIWELAQQKVRENIQLTNEKLTTELQFLKSQINPHFLFNALNNIYSLSMLQSDKTPDSIAQLSDMLRYVIYDCEKAVVPLKKELDYIRDYVELFQLKKTDSLNIQLDLPIEEFNLSVPPMLFIPFIENALKHSYIEDLKNSWVRISLQVDGYFVNLKVENSIPKIVPNKDKIEGIGLQNVQRRLDILFPSKYDLQIDNNDDQFNVNLNLNLQVLSSQNSANLENVLI